ncbi:MAG TPA: thiamine-phosphate kinase [Streptosporangiaceae bacterium]|nr:thiamine-phosphate kinase [Streptosporangiaceae bacterium]
MNVTISDLGEFGLIASFAERLPPGEATLVGIGDDAAVLAMPDGRVVASTDLLIEGRHFRRDWSAPEEIGGKAAAQNLADLAAMGAGPTALLVGLAVPAAEPADWVQRLVTGLARECADAGATVAGGDLASADTVMIAITALGHLAGRAPVTRAGARPGDVLAVAGLLGHSAAGLALLSAGLSAPAAPIAAHRWPHPPYQAGPEAARLGATAMIDVSDGLVADLGHVARASGVLIDVDSGRLPRPPVLAEAAAALAAVPAARAGAGGADVPLGWVLAGGEDHALAATFGPQVALPPHWTVVGRVAKGRGVLVDGRVFPGRGGWVSFPDNCS